MIFDFSFLVNSSDPSILTSTKRFCRAEAQDLYLGVTLECWTANQIFILSDEIKIPVWSKVDISIKVIIFYLQDYQFQSSTKKDLLKKERRKPKGSAAQLRVKRNEDNNQAWLEDVPRRLRSLNPDQIRVLQNIINQVQTE